MSDIYPVHEPKTLTERLAVDRRSVAKRTASSSRRLDMEPLKTSSRPKGKAAAKLWMILKEQYPDTCCECKFEWLKVPTAGSALSGPIGARSHDILRDVRDALVDHCAASGPTQRNAKKRECVPGVLRDSLDYPVLPQTEFDFFIPSLKVAIEFDERQHFSEERAVSLRAYPQDFQCHYDIKDWIRRSDRIKAIHQKNIYRDWQRAYRDSVRDVLAESMDIRMFRFTYDMLLKSEWVYQALTHG